MKTVAQDAVTAINEQNRGVAQAKAITLIKSIVDLQDAIERDENDIESLQKQLEKVAKSEITIGSVMGTNATPPNTETARTVIKAIETLVKSKQGCVEQRATQLAEQIVSKRSSIEAINKNIAEKQAELAKIEVKVVTETDVLN